MKWLEYYAPGYPLHLCNLKLNEGYTIDSLKEAVANCHNEADFIRTVDTMIASPKFEYEDKVDFGDKIAVHLSTVNQYGDRRTLRAYLDDSDKEYCASEQNEISKPANNKSERELFNNGACAYEELSAAVNNTCFDRKKFCEAFVKDHRYLQGEVFQLALEIIKTCANDNYAYDGRNEFCHTIAKKLAEKVPEVF